jgi:hypothetical protein
VDSGLSDCRPLEIDRQRGGGHVEVVAIHFGSKIIHGAAARALSVRDLELYELLEDLI